MEIYIIFDSGILAKIGYKNWGLEPSSDHIVTKSDEMDFIGQDIINHLHTYQNPSYLKSPW